jgi:hypothetical protein
VIYPNPSTGIFKLLLNGTELIANQILILNSLGKYITTFNNTNQFNISNLPAGLYWYKVVIKQKEFSGKLVKL